ncbi:MAG TPA: tRNA (adenosine(37)-N6)-dimethylallyltransferase MiaA [Patescibacteria group bacterium]|nr:tRNA (adenosine(37)-N6)-dimethylallyltransferase MiaA [Patescibacteria group bacterium]
MNINNKLIVILGPTATGKTKVAARLAVKFNGEIISADSRQVYQGMDIGTGKDLDDYVVKRKTHSAKRKTISYHLIDVVGPKTEFNVAKYQKLAYQAIDNVLSRGKVPFLVGGTGLYIDAVVNGYAFSVTHSAKRKTQNIRDRLNKLSLRQLLARLKKVDLETYQVIDHKNRRRVQRALEIYYISGKPKSAKSPNQLPPYEILVLGIKYPLQEIYQKIDSRLGKRMKQGMISEIKNLRRQRVSWQRLDDFGLEYRWVANYLRGKISYEQMISGLKNAIHHFAKRQITWFKRNKDIIWIKNYADARDRIKKFLK